MIIPKVSNFKMKAKNLYLLDEINIAWIFLNLSIKYCLFNKKEKETKHFGIVDQRITVTYI